MKQNKMKSNEEHIEIKIAVIAEEVEGDYKMIKIVCDNGTVDQLIKTHQNNPDLLFHELQLIDKRMANDPNLELAKHFEKSGDPEEVSIANEYLRYREIINNQEAFNNHSSKKIASYYFNEFKKDPTTTYFKIFTEDDNATMEIFVLILGKGIVH